MKPKPIIASLAALALLAGVGSLQAQTINTRIGGDGNFFDPVLWDLGTIPGTDPTEILVIDNGTTSTIAVDAGTHTFGALRLGSVQDGTESGHVIMNGGVLKIGGTVGDPKVLNGNSATLSTFIMNSGTIFHDGPDAFPGSTGDDGVNGLDWEVGEKGLGRFEMHGDAIFRGGDDLKVAENAAGSGSVLIDGNAWLSVGSGISISSGGTTLQTMVVGGNATVDSGNGMGAGDPLGATDEGYLTMGTSGGHADLIIQDNAVMNIRRLTARDGESLITVKNNGQFHIFNVLLGKGNKVNPPDRPVETGPGSDANNSTYPSTGAGVGAIILQDNAQMTVNSAPSGGVVQGLGIGGPRGTGDAGGRGTLSVRDAASFKVEQDLGLGAGRNPDTSSGTLEVVGPSAIVWIGANLNMAVDPDGNVYGLDVDSNPKAGKAIFAPVITGPTHSVVTVGGIARIANGTLKLRLNGYTPALGATYTLIQGGTIEGQFAATDYSQAQLAAGQTWQVEYAADSVKVKVVAAPAGKTITVTTADNANPGDGTSLVMALQMAGIGDTIAFNIPGAGPHYIKTPVNGYPRIESDNITVDGYSQPGAAANTNPIHAANNAKLKIVLDSREGGRTVMNYNTGRPGYGDSETAILGVFNAANVTIKGLCFLGLHTANSDEDPGIYCLAFARDHFGGPDLDDNAHIAGCWFGVEPDGTSVTGGSATAIAAFRHRDVSGGPLPELPNRNMIVGVKPGSANPRAEFNVIVDMSYALAGEQTGTRLSGNFMGVLPDGVTPYDMVALGRPFAGSTFEIGRYSNSTIIVGTDGDGVNDADEGNVFGPLSEGSTVIAFYGTNNKRYIIAGNYFGVAVDGVTPFPGSFRIIDEIGGGATAQFGSDFDGVSDAVEGNVVVNNQPFSTDFPIIDPIASAPGAKISVRGNRLINNFPLPVNIAVGSNPNPLDFYTPHLVNPAVIQPVITAAGSELIGTCPVAVAAFLSTEIDLYEADPDGITNGKTAAIELLPNGYVQGRNYLGSFVDNSPQDLDPAAGAFRFNIAAMNLNGKNLTLTANYSEMAAGSHNAKTVTSPFSEPMVVTASAEIRLAVTRIGNVIRVSWPAAANGGVLESKASLSDPNWTSEGQANPTDINIGTGAKFLRLRK